MLRIYCAFTALRETLLGRGNDIPTQIFGRRGDNWVKQIIVSTAV